MSGNNVVDKPRFIDIHQYVEQRAAQVASLLQTVDNNRLVSGEVTKGPRTAAQRLPRHMRRRAMAYNVRRFPKGLRLFAGPYIATTKHRDKPPCRFFRRRSKNLLLNYIRRQRKAVWLETHIWHAKRFHMVDRWGYRLPDRSFQRNFRPCYRDAVRHCSIRDKSYLSCFVITHESQQELIDLLRPLCNSGASPSFAFKSALDGRYEMSALLFHPGKYPQGLIGPVRFLWSKEGSLYRLAIWSHPSCRDELLLVLTDILQLVKNAPIDAEVSNASGTETEAAASTSSKACPKTVEEWRLGRMKIETNVYSSKDGKVTMEDLRDQMVRLRLHGPMSLTILTDCLKLVTGKEAELFSDNHEEWSSTYSSLSSGQLADGSVFSLLVEDPRISRPAKRQVPHAELDDDVDCEVASLQHAVTQGVIWNRDLRMDCLQKRLTDSELNTKKGDSVTCIESTACKIPLLVVVRNGASGKSETLDGVELILPCGFGADFWIAAQMRTAHASGRRDDLSAHLEARKLEFPTDAFDCTAGVSEEKRISKELSDKHARRPHNRRVVHWKNMSVKYPFTFEFKELMEEWLTSQKQKLSGDPYVLRDRRTLVTISDWLSGKNGKLDPSLLAQHHSSLVPVEIECIARGRPKKFALVCLPTKDDLLKVERRHRDGPVVIVQPPRGKEEHDNLEDGDAAESMDASSSQPTVSKNKTEWQSEMWKDVVSTDLSTREKPIPLKPLFPDTKQVDKALKRRLVNRAKKEKAKKRRLERGDRLRVLNEEAAERDASSYREAANRLTIGRVVRGDYSFSAARGRALAYVPLCTLAQVRASGSTVLVRNISSKYYHPANISVLKGLIEI